MLYVTRMQHQTLKSLFILLVLFSSKAFPSKLQSCALALAAQEVTVLEGLGGSGSLYAVLRVLRVAMDSSTGAESANWLVQLTDLSNGAISYKPIDQLYWEDDGKLKQGAELKRVDNKVLYDQASKYYGSGDAQKPLFWIARTLTAAARDNGEIVFKDDPLSESFKFEGFFMKAEDNADNLRGVIALLKNSRTGEYKSYTLFMFEQNSILAVSPIK